MESVGISVEAMAEVNRKLTQFLDTLQPTRASHSVTPEQMSAVFAELVRVAEWKRAGAAQHAQGPLAEELSRYHRLLEQLRQVLPSLHARLLTERSRLQAERTHLDAASAWARSLTRQTR